MDGSFRCGSSVRCKGRVDGVVLTQGIALPVLGEQDPPEVGMTLEPDAEHVVALALHPVGAAVESGQRGAARLARAGRVRIVTTRPASRFSTRQTTSSPCSFQSIAEIGRA